MRNLWRHFKVIFCLRQYFIFKYISIFFANKEKLRSLTFKNIQLLLSFTKLITLKTVYTFKKMSCEYYILNFVFSEFKPIYLLSIILCLMRIWWNRHFQTLLVGNETGRTSFLVKRNSVIMVSIASNIYMLNPTCFFSETNLW